MIQVYVYTNRLAECKILLNVAQRMLAIGHLYKEQYIYARNLGLKTEGVCFQELMLLRICCMNTINIRFCANCSCTYLQEIVTHGPFDFIYSCPLQGQFAIKEGTDACNGPEFKAFKMYSSKLGEIIPLDLVQGLYSNDLISRQLREDVVTTAGESRSQKVGKLLNGLEGQIEANPSRFKMLLSVLRTDSSLADLADNMAAFHCKSNDVDIRVSTPTKYKVYYFCAQL